jgi:hypothetical protein
MGVLLVAVLVAGLGWVGLGWVGLELIYDGIELQSFAIDRVILRSVGQEGCTMLAKKRHQASVTSTISFLPFWKCSSMPCISTNPKCNQFIERVHAIVMVQVLRSSTVHRYRHPSWRWSAGRVLCNRSSDDGVTS